MKSNIWKIFLSAVVTAVLVIYSVSVLDISELRDFRGSINWLYMAFAVLSYAFTYPLRALRIYSMAKPWNSGYFRTFLICCRHQFFGRVVPFKIGDLSLVYLLKRHVNVPVASGGALLLMLRFFDGIIMLGAFLACSFVADTDFVPKNAVAILLFCMVVCLLVLPLLLNIIIAKAKGIIRDMAVMLKNISGKHAFLIILQSLLLWVFVYLSMHFVVMAFECKLSLFETISASFFASLAAFLPINGLGGFGTTEAGWTIGFMAMGLSRSVALISGIASNIMSFAVVCVFGFISFLAGRFLDVQNDNSQQ